MTANWHKATFSAANGGELVPAGTGQEAVAERLSADPTVAFVHTRNVLHGCYTATIERG